MKFQLSIKTDNAAFAAGNRNAETARILAEIAKKINEGNSSGKARDLNGNTVGAWAFTR